MSEFVTIYHMRKGQYKHDTYLKMCRDNLLPSHQTSSWKLDYFLHVDLLETRVCLACQENIKYTIEFTEEDFNQLETKYDNDKF